MIAPMDLQARVQQYLTERRRLGFHLRSPGHALPNFARFVKASKHTGALTVELMAQWARQAQGGKASAETAARRLAWLRPFLRWLQQFEPQTEVPDDSTFGPIPGRLAPHIYRPEEIEALLQAARQLGPCDGLRAATYETLFGLIASAGLRISEAIALADIDVDLQAGVLTVRQTKFGKSRLVPVHPSVIAAPGGLPRTAQAAGPHDAADAVLRRLARAAPWRATWRPAGASDVRTTPPAARLG